MTKSGGVNLSKMARIDHELAELTGEEAELHARKARLLGERAKILAGMATDNVVIETGRREPARHVPRLSPVSEMDQMRAKQALAEMHHRRVIKR